MQITVLVMWQTSKTQIRLFMVNVSCGCKNDEKQSDRVQAYHFGKKDFELGVEWKGQDTSRHFKGIFGSIRAILPV